MDPFPFGVRLGIVLIAEASIISAVAVVSLFLYAIYNTIVNNRKAGTKKWFTPSPFHWYLTSLFVSEATTATGGIMGLRWAIRASVQEGPFCKAQGILFQLGNVGVALATLAIAFHTFAILVYNWQPKHPIRVAQVVVAGIWVSCTLIIGINAATHMRGTYWGDTQYWCWIKKEYPVQQIALEYAFLFLATFVNIVLYIPIAAVVSGKVTVTGFKFHLVQTRATMSLGTVGPDNSDDILSGHARANKRVALKMLCFPLVYTITTVPVAAARFSAFHDERVPFPVTTFAAMVFSLSGFFNVTLFALTRSTLIPRWKDISSSTSMQSDNPLMHDMGTNREAAGSAGGGRKGVHVSIVRETIHDYESQSVVAISVVSSGDESK